MATSGSVDFSMNRNEIIGEALRHIGVGVTGETLSNEEVSDASKTLNLQLKAWMAEGIHLWKREEISLTLVEGQNTYTIGNSGSPDLTADPPLKIISAIREHTDGGVATMEQLSYNEYHSLPNKDTKSTPTEFMFIPPNPNNNNLATVKVWPSPDATAASDWTFKFVVQTPTEDVDSGTDDLDIPPYMLEAVKYGLAYRLAPQYGLPLEERAQLARDTSSALQRALDFDTEWSSVYFRPDSRGLMR